MAFNQGYVESSVSLKNNAEMSQSKPLRDSTKTVFYSFAATAGFERAKASPLSVLFFRTRPTNVQWFEIQWDKYHRPSFIINFGEITQQKLQALTDDPIARPPSEYDLPIAGRLRRNAGESEHWFSIRKPVWQAATTLSLYFRPEEIVDQLIQNFAELEAWWDTKSVGPHIQLSDW